MNWKGFKEQVNSIETWFACLGYHDNQILYKLLIFILRGEDNPGNIVAATLSVPTIREAARTDLSDITPFENLPDNIHELLFRWIHTLPRNPEFLGEVYENLALDKRTKGLYYTPSNIIDFILSKTVSKCDVLANPLVKIIDLSCGCGSFLLKAYDILYKKFSEVRSQLARLFPDSNWTDDDIRRHIITYNLWGVDIDSIASDIAYACLILKSGCINSIAEAHIMAADSLGDTMSSNCDFLRQQYDYVIGNPPYMSFGFRGAKKIGTEYLDYLRGAYVSAQYKLSIYALFMQRGIDILAPNGKLGFIVPDSFLLGRYYSKIREYILKNTTIDVLAHITAPIFKNVSTGHLAVCVFTKTATNITSGEPLISTYQIEDCEFDLQLAPQCQYSQSYFQSLPLKRFRIFFSQKTKLLI